MQNSPKARLDNPVQNLLVGKPFGNLTSFQSYLSLDEKEIGSFKH
jgi:hypothetical protein